MQNHPQSNSYEVYDIQEDLIATAENGEIYALKYGEVETLSYLNGILSQLKFEQRCRAGSWLLEINEKCTIYIYFNRSLNSLGSDLNVSTLIWRGEYTRFSGKTEVRLGGFPIEESRGKVRHSEFLGEEIIDKVRDFLEDVDEMIEQDNLQILEIL